jgi:Lrp/AsnC family transcriptional regulator for asnA, asnC and gidA
VNNVETLDTVDRKILNMLQSDARVSFALIGAEAGVSEATVRYRVKQLEKAGIIKNYTALLDSGKVGWPTTGIMMVKLVPELFEPAAKAISELPETYHIFQTTGEFDLLSVVHTRDLAHLIELRKTVKLIDGVQDVSVVAATRMLKIKTSFDL